MVSMTWQGTDHELARPIRRSINMGTGHMTPLGGKHRRINEGIVSNFQLHRDLARYRTLHNHARGRHRKAVPVNKIRMFLRKRFLSILGYALGPVDWLLIVLGVGSLLSGILDFFQGDSEWVISALMAVLCLGIVASCVYNYSPRYKGLRRGEW